MTPSSPPFQATQQTETSTTLTPDSERPLHLRVPGLTMVAHPDPSRVGEEVALPELVSGGEVRLSRSEPAFAAPARDDAVARPIGVSHISRDPVVLRQGPDLGGVVLDVRGSRITVCVAGEELRGETAFSAAEVERGVVLVLRRRVALLLHPVDSVPRPAQPHFGLVGDSSAAYRLRQEIQSAAGLELPVLLRGETGTGKELVARALHENSRRADRPFLAVNMGALVPALAASELFGAVRGAYTGAERTKMGFFRSADGGTLFLDEIGEAPPEVQATLLRALENREVQPVGSVETFPVDVRVIAATDADLGTAMGEGRFRPALLHRLAGYEIRVPALRHRRDDVARLLHFFMDEEAAELTGSVPGETPYPPADVIARLVEHDWPGNVRQLRNVTRRLVIAGARGGAEAQRVVTAELLTPPSEPPRLRLRPPSAASAPAPRRRRGSEVGEDELLAALAANAWELKPTAAALGVSRATLYRLVDSCPKIRKAAELLPAEVEAAVKRHGGDHQAAARELRVSPQGLKRRITALGLADP